MKNEQALDFIIRQAYANNFVISYLGYVCLYQYYSQCNGLLTTNMISPVIFNIRGFSLTMQLNTKIKARHDSIAMPRISSKFNTTPLLVHWQTAVCNATRLVIKAELVMETYSAELQDKVNLIEK
jgi:hypothetical protein